MHYRRFPECQIIINTSCMFLINKGAAVDGFIQRFQAANILPKGESEELFARYAQVAEPALEPTPAQAELAGGLVEGTPLPGPASADA